MHIVINVAGLLLAVLAAGGIVWSEKPLGAQKDSLRPVLFTGLVAFFYGIFLIVFGLAS
jgi:hypothetical protein